MQQQQQQAPVRQNSGPSNLMANHPITRFLTSLELPNDAAQVQRSNSISNLAAAILTTSAAAPAPLPAYLTFGTPIATIATTPAIFVSTSLES
ncbi:hypothetical protein IW150_003525, partial [Coemansia sp. RSA 2607]